ncbi:uncharacterized protein K452DRAFT_337487 [Aplosporella prunicola CBS 121167]|uniref:Uncharacterized protein n=1 Tax=Aplosporella prunicola CBS 121167 TaxID=1176127 RepID=A0A6A6B7W0_9PEZI|nr:uncharacterized protein K452DRAFT_337487 [Aplosporella prunicola CBS 121167]KAF2139345.1 hypothetical protein K452DRAFT_337487 [Aplosporella prunicola CBS 121167]
MHDAGAGIADRLPRFPARRHVNLDACGTAGWDFGVALRLPRREGCLTWLEPRTGGLGQAAARRPAGCFQLLCHHGPSFTDTTFARRNDATLPHILAALPFFGEAEGRRGVGELAHDCDRNPRIERADACICCSCCSAALCSTPVREWCACVHAACVRAGGWPPGTGIRACQSIRSAAGFFPLYSWPVLWAGVPSYDLTTLFFFFSLFLQYSLRAPVSSSRAPSRLPVIGACADIAQRRELAAEWVGRERQQDARTSRTPTTASRDRRTAAVGTQRPGAI